MSNELDIRNLVFHKNEFTNCFLISCVKYTWKFNLNNKTHIIFLFYIKLFGKRQIFLDNKKIYDKSKFTYNFIFSFPVEYCNIITICQKENCYILKINDISFNKILNDLKIKKFNILEDNYKIKQEEKKKKRLQKLKNKILLETVKNFGKKQKDVVEINLNNEKNDEDDSKTIHQSFEINEKDLDTLNKLNNFNNNKNTKNNNNKNNKKDKTKKKDEKRNKKFKPKEKKNHNIYKNMETSYVDMIDYDLLGYDSIISGENGSTNIYESKNSSSSKQNKDSTKTESK